jgi:hypothetical protein
MGRYVRAGLVQYRSLHFFPPRVSAPTWLNNQLAPRRLGARAALERRCPTRCPPQTWGCSACRCALAARPPFRSHSSGSRRSGPSARGQAARLLSFSPSCGELDASASPTAYPNLGRLPRQAPRPVSTQQPTPALFGLAVGDAEAPCYTAATSKAPQSATERDERQHLLQQQGTQAWPPSRTGAARPPSRLQQPHWSSSAGPGGCRGGRLSRRQHTPPCHLPGARPEPAPAGKPPAPPAAASPTTGSPARRVSPGTPWAGGRSRSCATAAAARGPPAARRRAGPPAAPPAPRRAAGSPASRRPASACAPPS